MMMIDEAVVNRRFLKILLPGFSNKLSIPNAFIKANGNHKGRDKKSTTVTLVSPKGKVCHVGLYKKRESVYIGGDGWAQLAAANGLQVGHALVLRYRGNMVFSFRIFDLSACEKDYSNCNRSSLPQMDLGRDKRSRSSVPTHEVKDDDEEDTSSTKMNNCGTTEGNFVITIMPSHISQSCTFILVRYRESSGLTEEDTEIGVRDPMGRMWAIGLYRRRGTSDANMTRGWLQFARENKLKVGDRCVFELVSTQKEKGKVFRVKIINDLKP